LVVAALVVLSACSKSSQDDKQLAPLLEGLGPFHHAITTKDPMAQRFFDQGLMLAIGFNHAEAERSFREAARRDPSCAMCYWGIALVLGPNINAKMDPAAVPKAWEAMETAVRLANQTTEVEMDYIEALTERYSDDPEADRIALDVAYADAMKELVSKHPDDLDARALLAEALMDLHPWDYWEKNGEPRFWTPEIIEILESVRAAAPDHPLANHLYIHAVEASPTPEKGLDAAARLGKVAPGAGHLVHMPSHIYIRTGHYHEGTLANQRAMESDHAYINQCHAQGIYPLAYVPHNHHFLWATATLEGASALAMDAARSTAAMADSALLQEPGFGTLQHYYVIPLYSMVRFGKWDDILKEPQPAEELVYPRGIWHYARGIAFVRTDDTASAEEELKRVREIAANPELGNVTIWDINATTTLMEIASFVLAGEIAAQKGEFDAAVRELVSAIRIEDRLTYNEPPDWFFPVRQTLGAVLLEAGRPKDAEAIYREDLSVYPKNGWSLFGLAKSLREQNKIADAEDAERQFTSAWAYADITLTASRF
jgi:tetratricopeptide (TPR) repeat protein